MSRWELPRRLLVTLLTVVLVVAVGVGVAVASFVSMRDYQRQVVDGYYEAVTTSSEQFVGLLDMESAVRGYALTQDEEALQSLQEAEQRLGSGAGDRLRTLLRNDPETLAAFDRAAQSASRWWQGWAQPAIADMQAGGAPPTDAEVATGARLFEQLRSDYADYIETLSDHREMAVDDLHARNAWLLAAVVAVAVVAVGAVALLALLLRRWVTRPLRQLGAETRIVRSGELHHPVQVQGPPEIARLGGDVDDMRRSLVDQIAAARTATRELESAKLALEVQAEDLARSNRELEQFAYVASHDLQEPLRKVASFTQMLQKRYAGQLDDRADQYIEFAVDGAKRMQQLINDLLQFSRVGRITAPQADVDLDRSLDRVLHDLEDRLEEAGAVVTRDPLPVVRGESALLTQVLANLVGNALKFRSQEAPRIHVGARREGDEWHLWVSDNGIGIEPQYAERVFVLFQRLHPKDAYAGTGIGLALARKIVEYHGGLIDLDADAEGPGTTIRFTLPAADAAPAAPDEGPEGESRDHLRQDDVMTTGSGEAR